MRVTRVTLDASALVRAFALQEPRDEAFDWLVAVHEGRVRAIAPELLFAEVANTLLMYARAGSVELATAQQLLDGAVRLPIVTFPLRELAPAALTVASARGLSAYDACYVALAEQAGVPLLTADGRAAAAAADSIFLR